MGIKLFLNIFLNVDLSQNTVVSSDKIRSSRRLTDVVLCRVCVCRRGVFVDEHSMGKEIL